MSHEQSPQPLEFRVLDHEFGRSRAPVVVAELGINHGGSISVAKQMADAAVSAGARYIKHQTHIPDAEMSVEARKVIPGNSHLSIFEVIEGCALTESEEFDLKEHIEAQGAVFFSTPFSIEAADRLESWDVPLFKIGSGECGHLPLIERVASFGKPVILSTGMHSLDTVSEAVRILREGNVPFALLQATNLYPTPSHLIQLEGIRDLSDKFADCIPGLSDHSLTIGPAIASVALGARIIEKHFTDSKSRGGPDIACSMDPMELRRLIAESHEVFVALGEGKIVQPEEQVTRNFAFPSVVVLRDVAPGEVLSAAELALKRPSGGDFGPKDLKSLEGRKVINFLSKNTQLRESDISDGAD